jgi:hypothetical protein
VIAADVILTVSFPSPPSPPPAAPQDLAKEPPIVAPGGKVKCRGLANAKSLRQKVEVIGVRDLGPGAEDQGPLLAAVALII